MRIRARRERAARTWAGSFLRLALDAAVLAPWAGGGARWLWRRLAGPRFRLSPGASWRRGQTVGALDMAIVNREVDPEFYRDNAPPLRGPVRKLERLHLAYWVDVFRPVPLGAAARQVQYEQGWHL